MKYLIYEETDDFYTTLDRAIENKDKVTISFQRNQLDNNAGLWNRLLACSNGAQIAADLKKQPKQSMSRSLISSNIFTRGTRPFRLAQLLRPVHTISYMRKFAPYNKHKIWLEIDPVAGKAELKIEPPSTP